MDNTDELEQNFPKLNLGANAESGDVSGGAKKKTQTGGKTQPVDKRKAVTCKDEDNQEVDWFILYKTPRVQDKGMTGLDYVYIYPDQTEKRVMSKHNRKPINHPEGILANTLRPLFTESPPQDFGFISYNDQVPEGYSARVRDPTNEGGGSAPDSFGHSKGVVMVQKDNNGGKGVWLLHSTPQFPYKRDKNKFWPDTGANNAQIFICVTFNYDQFEHIGKHLQYIKAFSFDHHIPKDFHGTLQQPGKRAKGINIPPGNFQLLTSSGGKEFKSIAKQVSPKGKGKPEDGDLYVTIAKEIKSDVNVQSWGGQRDRDVSFCPAEGRKVQNITSVKTGLGEWGCGSDHSKWCVAVDPKKPWTCIGDVNRAKTQYERRGGALCVKDEEIRKIFQDFVLKVDGCPQ